MNRTFSFVIAALFTFFILLQPSIQTKQAETFDKKLYEWTKPLTEVFHQFNSRYYETVDPEEAMIKAMNAFASHFDPHSCVLNQKSAVEINETVRGEICGIGVHIPPIKNTDDEFLLIDDIAPAGPADKAGVKPRDRIVEIDGETLKGLSLDEVIAKLKGKKNTTVTIKVQRSNTTKLLSFTITRDIVKETNALCYYFKDIDIYYLSLNLFTETSVSQVKELLEKINQKPAKGLILDLRNNTGGYFNAAIDIAGLFLDKDSLVVSIKGKQNKISEQYKTTKDPIFKSETPIFILVNNYTASAAEILAGALQAHATYTDQSNQKRCNPFIFVVGESKTFGKGSVQELIPLDQNCLLRLTTAIYYLPNNSTIQGKGVRPDFKVKPKLHHTKEMKWLNKQFGRESRLSKTIKTESSEKKKKPNKKEKREKSWAEKKEKHISSDHLIVNTVRLIEMLNLARAVYPKDTETRKSTVSLLKKLYQPEEKLTLEEIKI